MSYQEARGNRFLSSFTVWVVIKGTVMTVCIRVRARVCKHVSVMYSLRLKAAFLVHWEFKNFLFLLVCDSPPPFQPSFLFKKAIPTLLLATKTYLKYCILSW